MADDGWLSDAAFDSSLAAALNAPGTKYTASALGRSIRASHSGNVVYITVQSATPTEAAQIERTVVNQIVTGGLASLAQRHGFVTADLLSMQRGNGDISVRLDSASAESAKATLALRLALGVAWGVIIAVSVEYVRRRQRSAVLENHLA